MPDEIDSKHGSIAFTDNGVEAQLGDIVMTVTSSWKKGGNVVTPRTGRVEVRVVEGDVVWPNECIMFSSSSPGCVWRYVGGRLQYV